MIIIIDINAAGGGPHLSSSIISSLMMMTAVWKIGQCGCCHPHEKSL
jgi:hypothetical protein